MGRRASCDRAAGGRVSGPPAADDPTSAGRRRAIILADGDVADRSAFDAAWPGWSDHVAFVVAADGGARHAVRLGLGIDRWVGDGDSIEPEQLDELRASGVPIDLVAADKDESDTELAIDAAVAAGADEVIVIGAFGGRRFDHAIANLTLLAHPALGSRPAILLDGSARVRLVRAPGPDGGPVVTLLPGRVGDLVSLIPFGGDADRIRTVGLHYPLRDETLVLGSARGLSNVRSAADASFVLGRGLILVIETPATL
jgi:thiamine pyrophosphokinase